jgi:hypothetical protein
MIMGDGAQAHQIFRVGVTGRERARCGGWWRPPASADREEPSPINGKITVRVGSSLPAWLSQDIGDLVQRIAAHLAFHERIDVPYEQSSVDCFKNEELGLL